MPQTILHSLQASGPDRRLSPSAADSVNPSLFPATEAGPSSSRDTHDRRPSPMQAPRQIEMQRRALALPRACLRADGQPFTRPVLLENGATVEHDDVPAGSDGWPNTRLQGVIDDDRAGHAWEHTLADSLTLEPFTAPVQDSKEQVYDLDSLRTWLRDHTTSPLTNEPLGAPGTRILLRHNYAVACAARVAAGLPVDPFVARAPVEVTLRPAAAAPGPGPQGSRGSVLLAPTAAPPIPVAAIRPGHLAPVDLDCLTNPEGHLAGSIFGCVGGATWATFTWGPMCNVCFCCCCHTVACSTVAVTGLGCPLGVLAGYVTGLAAHHSGSASYNLLALIHNAYAEHVA